MARKDGGLRRVSWAEAERLLADGLREAGKDVAVISGDDNGSASEVFASLAAALGGEFSPMPSESRDAAKAWKAMGGRGRVGYDIENSDYVLLIGADAMETWGTPARNYKAFSAGHPSDGKASSKWVCCGPVRSGAGAVSDRFVNMLPGAGEALALGVAGRLIEAGAAPSGVKGLNAFKRKVLSGYSPKAVSKLTGVPARELDRIASELMRARRPLVIVGSGYSQGSGARAIMAGLAVNVLLGRVNKPGGVKALPEAPAVMAAAGEGRDAYRLLADVRSGKAAPKALLVHEANPAYALPEAARTAEALDRIPFKVSFSSFMDETAEKADLVLPSPLTLERYDDVYTPYGSGKASYSVARPLADAGFDVRNAPDVALRLAASLGKNLGHADFESVIEAKASALGADLKGLARGRAWSTYREVAQYGLDLSGAAAAPKATETRGLALAPMARMGVGTPRVATPPHSAKNIRESELDKGRLVALMNSRTARENGIRDGDKVTLKGSAGEARAVVRISEKVMNGVVAAPLGLGHTAWDEFSRGKGDNVNKLLTASVEPETGALAWTGSRVAVAKS
jgi:anaerobic selenocysteine-containing dehydrogenase